MKIIYTSLLIATIATLSSCSTVKDMVMGAINPQGGGISASASYEKVEGTKTEHIETNASKTETTQNVSATEVAEVNATKRETTQQADKITNIESASPGWVPWVFGFLVIVAILGWVSTPPQITWRKWRNK